MQLTVEETRVSNCLCAFNLFSTKRCTIWYRVNAPALLALAPPAPLRRASSVEPAQYLPVDERLRSLALALCTAVRASVALSPANPSRTCMLASSMDTCKVYLLKFRKHKTHTKLEYFHCYLSQSCTVKQQGEFVRLGGLVGRTRLLAVAHCAGLQRKGGGYALGQGRSQHVHATIYNKHKTNQKKV